MSLFDAVTLLPEDPILSLPIAYAADPCPNKVNLGVGSYKDAEGLPVVLTAIKKAEPLIIQQNLTKEYLPIEGHPGFLKHSLALIFGKDCPQVNENEVFASQSVGGTSALRIGADFLVAQDKQRTLYLPDPTWANHKLIFNRAGLKMDYYPYYNDVRHSINFDEMIRAITQMPAGSVILLHACCQNPTGIDLTFSQWQELSTLLKKQKIIPFFDFAYQGFGLGIEEDAQAIRYFVKEGHEMFVATSFSKNMGLYGERVGMLSFVGNNKETVRNVSSHIKQIIRASYSNPPLHGVRIAAKILSDPSLKQEWVDQLAVMRERIYEMRKTFVAGLLAKGVNKDFSFINKQKGIFSFIGLDRNQVSLLRQDFGIYMPANGRINVAGLNLKNMDYVIEAILSVINT